MTLGMAPVQMVAAFAAGLVLLATADRTLAQRVVTGTKVPAGTNAPVQDPVVRNHGGSNGEGGVTVTSHPRQPNPCSGFFHACIEEGRDHRPGWKGPPGSTVHDHRN